MVLASKQIDTMKYVSVCLSCWEKKTEWKISWKRSAKDRKAPDVILFVGTPKSVICVDVFASLWRRRQEIKLCTASPLGELARATDLPHFCCQFDGDTEQRYAGQPEAWSCSMAEHCWIQVWQDGYFQQLQATLDFFLRGAKSSS